MTTSYGERFYKRRHLYQEHHRLLTTPEDLRFLKDMNTAKIVPSEPELLAALVDLRAQNPALGITKLHALLLAGHPEWTVSAKRTKKILQSEGLALGPPSNQDLEKHKADGSAPGADSPFPVSKLVEGLDVAKWTSKVEVKYFGRSKGKGLVAKERIAEGEVVWKEDPFVLAPEWYGSQRCTVHLPSSLGYKNDAFLGRFTTCRPLRLHARTALLR